jgi:preprotein translocase subunit SecE
MIKKFIVFLKESKDELSKVVWPTRKQTTEMTIAVLIVVFIVGFYLGAVDFLLTKALTFLLGSK